jgi:hypothetical protein
MKRQSETRTSARAPSQKFGALLVRAKPVGITLNNF